MRADWYRRMSEAMEEPIGAASGAMAGHRASRIGRKQQQQANNQAAGQAEADMMNSFKKAYSACLQGKGYTVN